MIIEIIQLRWTRYGLNWVFEKKFLAKKRNDESLHTASRRA